MTPRLYRMGFTVCLFLASTGVLFWFVYRSNVQVASQSVALMGAEGLAGDRLRLVEDRRTKAGLLAVGFALGAAGFLYGSLRSRKSVWDPRGGAAPSDA